MDITSILQMHQELSLTAVFLLMFVLDLFLPVRLRHWLRPLACALLGIELLANIWPDEVILFGGMYHSTPMASIMKSVLTLGTILVFLQSTHWLRRSDTRHKMGEFYTLTLSTLLGMYFMVSAGHFLLFFLGLELATVHASLPSTNTKATVQKPEQNSFYPPSSPAVYSSMASQ